MSSAYSQARIHHYQSSPTPRKPLKSPSRPIALQQNYITNTKTTLVLIPPHSDASRSATAYTVKDHQDVQNTLFTASGYNYNDGSGSDSGSGSNVLATGSPRFAPAFGNFSLRLRNAAAVDGDGKGEEEEKKEVTLVVERHGRVLQSFDVIDGDRRVAEVRESVQHNDKLALRAGSRRGYRPAMDIVVTSGVDVALIVAIAIIASDSVFGSSSG
ncbi:hypothetical protein AbraCBS73388_000960 [Aspergillus brasiliensis]|uniref:Uncharacterized protein n=1 Tax=Aspergillus brasiliensis TaxID=319629 RepID=A0A9W5YMM1_9EURO|nr:hypothetical protein AbraCBS73388_000960 [Aspergillus brasiliensis]